MLLTTITLPFAFWLSVFADAKFPPHLLSRKEPGKPQEKNGKPKQWEDPVADQDVHDPKPGQEQSRVQAQIDHAPGFRAQAG